MADDITRIMVSVASKAASEIYAGTGNLDGYLVARKAIQTDLIEAIQENGFPVPSAITVPASPNGVQPAQNVAAQAVQNLQAGGIPVSPVQPQTDEEWWQHLVANPNDWYNNTGQGDTTVSGGTRPDFRAKELKDKDGRPKGLFLVSRRFNKTAPDYVFQTFGLTKPDLSVPQVPAAAAAAPVTPAANPF